MLGIVSLKLESWFDRRFLEIMRRKIAGDAAWDEDFDSRKTVAYRVPLPLSARVQVRLHRSDQSLSFARSLWEVVGLGPRLYVVDGAPLSAFAKPILLFLFDGLGAEPVATIRTDWAFTINDGVFPFFDPVLLRGWSIAGPGADALPGRLAGPPLPLAAEALAFGRDSGLPVLATLPPLSGPFPPSSVPIPREDPPPAIGEGPADDCAGKGVRLFFGLNFQAAQLKYDPAGKPTLDDSFFQETKQLARTFKERGYDTAVAQAGMTGAKTCADMINWLAAGIAAARPQFCDSECDQLVIYISAHGGNDDLSFDPSGTGYGIEAVTHGQLMDLLAGITALTRAPNKVYLILDCCNSGVAWQTPTFPAALRGMHVVTSTPGAGVSSVVYQTDLLCDALKNPKVKSWDDLLRWLAWLNATYKWGPGAGDHPQWANGDVDGCAAALKLVSATYEGDDIGVVVYTLTSPQGTTFMDGTYHGKSATPNHQLFPLRFAAKCFEALRIRLNFEVVQPPAPPGYKETLRETVDKLCDGSNGDVEFIVQAGPGPKKARLKFRFELKTEC